MLRFFGYFGALLAASVFGLLTHSSTRGDEPAKPTPSATEANPAVPAPGHSLHGEAFNDGPRHAAYLMPGMGKIHFATSTQKPEAQKLIDQGVGQLHSFLYFESERSFRQAARIDPDCAIAYWGMAMSNVNNARRAKSFMAEARKRAAKASRREALYIDALESFYKDGATDKAKRQNLLNGLEKVVHEFPDDIDARAWMVMVAWQNATDGIGSRQALDMVLDGVLAVEPSHPGAHHYRIHLWDSTEPARAEKSAGAYAATAPGIAHAWHMPGHTYTGLKRYADAAYQQEGSARVDHAYMIRDRVMPFEIHNYAHNNQWLCTSLSHIGRVKEAIAVARDLVEQPRDPQRNGPNDGGSAQRSGRARWSEILARYELWDALLDATNSGALDWSSVPHEQEQKAYTLGLAHAAKGSAAGLAAQIEILKKMSTPSAKTLLAELEGWRLLAASNIGQAFEQFAKATSMRPESLARAHLAARNYGFAETYARQAVEKNPNQVAPLAALVEIMLAVGKEKEAIEAYRQLERIGRAADRDLPVLRRLEPTVTRWSAGKIGVKKSGHSSAHDDGTDETSAGRIDLTTLGPLTWSPARAEPLAGADTSGTRWNLADHRGRSVLAIFFLGGKCVHCMQQLELFGKEFEALKKLNVDTIAISTDGEAACKALKGNKEGVKIPMPVLADPGLELFKRYRAHDDFEGQALHGTFLIDADGNVRYQRISADPFLEVEFIKTEAQRMNQLLARKMKAGVAVSTVGKGADRGQR